MSDYERDDDKGQNQPAWFAIADIDARSEAAYKKHTSFFEDSEHQDRVALVAQLLKGSARLYSKLFETARESKDGPFTEVKINHVQFAPGARDQLVEMLQEFGFKPGEYEYHKKAPCFRVFVK